MPEHSKILLLLVALLVLPVGAVSAHHSFATHFEMKREIVIVGELTEISIRNPHSYFTVIVTGDDGEKYEWEVESQSLALLGRSGISNDTMKLGELAMFRGMPSLDPQKRFMFANVITPQDRGAVVAASYGRLFSQHVPDNRPGISGVDRFTGKWLTLGFGAPQRIASSPMPLTAAGRAAHEAFEPRDASAADCVAPNLPAILVAPYIYEISHTAGRVVFSHEYNDIMRDVVIDSAEAVTSDPDFGQRTGIYEDGLLTVTSTNFPALSAGLASNWESNGNGADVPSSEQKRFVEQYTISEDGSRMRLQYWVSDPLYLTETYSREMIFVRVPFNTPVYEFNCDAEIARRSFEHAVL